MYEIVEDRERGLLRITLSGFWDLEEVDRYAADLAAASRRLGTRLRGRLVDCRELKVQSPAIMERLQSTIAALDAIAGARTALVLPISLTRIQGQRVFPGTDETRWFADEKAALGWLLTAGEGPEY